LPHRQVPFEKVLSKLTYWVPQIVFPLPFFTLSLSKGSFMNHIPPRVAAIHDLSCFGRCALTVIIPTLSVMGYQAVPIPTALLSTHTGGFTDLHFHDMTPHMERISDHFATLGVSFRAIYSGFLGSAEQIHTVSHIIDTFGSTPDEGAKLPLILVDPVMGDDGEAYSTYTPDLIKGMRTLCRKAHLLTPNLTEACFLTDTPYKDTALLSETDALAFANHLMDGLEQAFDAPQVVITGLHLADGTLANLGKNADGTRFTVRRPIQKRSYPGTGDIFASVLLGELLRTNDFEASCAYAADFISTLIRESATLPTPVRDGVALEPNLWRLCHRAHP
jgi:pyridoxine kinase